MRFKCNDFIPHQPPIDFFRAEISASKPTWPKSQNLCMSDRIVYTTTTTGSMNACWQYTPFSIIRVQNFEEMLGYFPLDCLQCRHNRGRCSFLALVSSTGMSHWYGYPCQTTRCKVGGPNREISVHNAPIHMCQLCLYVSIGFSSLHHGPSPTHNVLQRYECQKKRQLKIFS